MLKHAVSRLPPIELLWRDRNGGVIPVETSTTCFYEHGHPIFITVGRDVRKQRQHEAELRSAKEQAECANRAKTEFLATMSHELRTPLNAIIGFSEIMADQLFGTLGNSRYVEYAGNIRESGQHLLSVINDILDLSKAEAGKLELREEEVDLAETVSSSCRLMFERATQAGITLSNRIESLPLMRVDQRMMKQILLNLLTNAIKFSSAGGSVQVANRFDEAGDLLLTVADTGIGIAEEDIPRALQAFGQVDSVLTRTHEGTGLGLPLCKTLAELHGGSLAIESEVGRGTTVTVRLPHERILT
jgi:signal transduction histidine kinase